jgi:hypothetical protein
MRGMGQTGVLRTGGGVASRRAARATLDVAGKRQPSEGCIPSTYLASSRTRSGIHGAALSGAAVIVDGWILKQVQDDAIGWGVAETSDNIVAAPGRPDWALASVDHRSC